MKTTDVKAPRKGDVIDHEAYGRVLVTRKLSDGWFEIVDANGDDWGTTSATVKRVDCESDLSRNHSADKVTIWRGRPVPTVMCGYHAMREGLS